MHRAVDLFLLPLRDISANGFRAAFDGLGCDLQSGEQMHLLATVIERRILTHKSLHAPHAGREVCVVDVQFAVGGELAFMAPRT